MISARPTRHGDEPGGCHCDCDRSVRRAFTVRLCPHRLLRTMQTDGRDMFKLAVRVVNRIKGRFNREPRLMRRFAFRGAAYHGGKVEIGE